MAYEFFRENGNFVTQLIVEARDQGILDEIAYLEGGVAHTFRDLYEGAARAADLLAKHGVGPEDPVLIVLPDGVELVQILLGAAWVGAVPVPLNPDFHSTELGKAATIVRPRVVVSSARDTVSASVQQIPLDRFTGTTARPAATAPLARHPEDPAYAVLTSGTTGDPRLCVHTHGDPHAIQESFNGTILRLTENDVSFSASRMYFSFGLCGSLFHPLFSGVTAVLSPERPQPRDVLNAIAEQGVTVLHAQPSFYARLLDTEGAEQIGRLRLAIVAGEPLLPALEARLRGQLGDRMINALGASEVGNVFACAPAGKARAGWVGPVLPPYRIRVVDEEGSECEAGAEGRLEVRGPTVTFSVARYGDEVRHGPESWWPTGDLAIIDKDGFVRVLGRADDMEIVGGVNVHPVEIEELLTRHPQVSEAAVCAIRGRGPTQVRAYVVLRSGPETADAVRDALRAATSRELTWYKVPHEVCFVPELPRTPTGKLNRRQLRAMAND